MWHHVYLHFFHEFLFFIVLTTLLQIFIAKKFQIKVFLNNGPLFLTVTSPFASFPGDIIYLNYRDYYYLDKELVLLVTFVKNSVIILTLE